MRLILLILCFWLAAADLACAQQDKKTDDLKPADPDTGESTVEETTLGLLPNPVEKQGVKFAITYIGEVLGNPNGGLKAGSVYEDRINFAADVDLKACRPQATCLPCQHFPDRWRRIVPRRSV
jgi:porin